MWRLIGFVALLQLAQCSCPDGFELVRDGECRGMLTTVYGGFDQAATTAIALCADIQGKPIIIHNEEHQSYWKAQAPDTSDGFMILGLVCNTSSWRWQWSDGSTLDFRPSTGYNKDLDSECKPGVSWDIHPDGFWSYGSAGPAQMMSYGCTTQIAPVDPSADGCDAFDDDADDGVCYMVGASAASWEDAQLICQRIGANLASIHNPKENSFVRRLAVSKGALNGIFLGASSRLGKDNNFEWIDGSVWDYQNFYPGFPKPGFGECLAMDTTSTSGQWMNMDCGAKLPVACVRDQRSVSQPSCSSDTPKEGSIITSPGFPYTASMPCDYFLTVDAFKKVEMEVVMLEANSCCDSLVIYDGYLGGAVLAKLSGDLRNETFTTTSSNIMRVSWQPNGGVNVRGMAITFRGA